MQRVAKYQEQLERVQRWYERLERITQGQPFDLAPSYYVDDLYAFFLNCYHLKDWIKNDPTLVFPDKAKAVEQFIRATPSLSICADVCNSTKHLSLDRPPRSGHVPKLMGALYATKKDGKIIEGAIRCTVKLGEESLDVFQLATECIKAWKVFIETRLNLTTVSGLPHIRHLPVK
jgi:hypothetical protein